MPNKRGHVLSHTFDVGLITFAAIQLGLHISLWFVGFCAIIYATYFADNDRDNDEAPRRPSLGNRFWRAYGNARKHRGLSHWPIVGTLDRMIYIIRRVGGIAGELLIFVFIGWLIIEYFELIPWTHIGVFILAACLADINHTVVDVVWSFLKRSKYILVVAVLLFFAVIVYKLIL